jgi:hypothetical protein
MLDLQTIDSDWDKVRQALEDSRWDFRTVEGMIEDTGLPSERIEEALRRHGAEVRVSNVPDSKGRILYTLASKRMGLRELLANTQAFIAKST